jgi:flagellar motor switch protein FliN/FliY
MDMVDEEHSQNEEIVSGEEGELKEEAPSPEVSADDQGETGGAPDADSQLDSSDGAAEGVNESPAESEPDDAASDESPDMAEDDAEKLMLEEMEKMDGIDGSDDSNFSNLSSSLGSDIGNDVAEAMPVEFQQLIGKGNEGEQQNLQLLLDVTLPISIELGRTLMSVQDILNLGPGSVVELNKLAGEPVDLLVNKKIVAKGEVVVIDENFGLRVTSLISPADRLKSLGGDDA